MEQKKSEWASNKHPILSRFIQNNVGCKNNHLPKVKTKQKGMKKKYLSSICWNEFAMRSGKTENQELPENLPI